MNILENTDNSYTLLFGYIKTDNILVFIHDNTLYQIIEIRIDNRNRQCYNH